MEDSFKSDTQFEIELWEILLLEYFAEHWRATFTLFCQLCSIVEESIAGLEAHNINALLLNLIDQVVEANVGVFLFVTEYTLCDQLICALIHNMIVYAVGVLFFDKLIQECLRFDQLSIQLKSAPEVESFFETAPILVS